MIYTYPDYYKNFKCSADKCTETCCSGWQIVIDKKSLAGYKNGSKFPDIDFNNYVDFKHGVFKQKKDRRCAFLMDDNLCLLCKKHGEKAFCRTCRLYPKHIEEFENVREITLSLSCPEAADIILKRKEPAGFISFEDDKNEEYGDFDILLYGLLWDAREIMLKIIKNRDYPIDLRAGIVLGLCHDIEKRFNNGELFSSNELFSYAVTNKARKSSEDKINAFLSDKARVYTFMKNKFGKLLSLEPIDYNWINLYSEADYILYKKGAKHYSEWSKHFEKYMTTRYEGFDIQLEQLLVYFIFTYFCGSVYDGRIYGKGKLAVYSTYYIKELAKAAFIRNNGTISEEEIINIAVRYSRELEHSDENLNRIEMF